MSDRPTSIHDLDFTPRAAVFASPEDWRDQFIYQLLIDRFDNNDPDVPPFDPDKARRGRDRKQGSRFQGGNLRGVMRRLDYIRGLGCTTLWISPPFKQRRDDPGSYHGYGAQDFLAIDPRFGTTEDLVELVREAHKRGMYVVLDIVVNHAGDVFAYKQQDTPYPQQGTPYREEGQYEFGHWRYAGSDKTSGPLGPDDGVWPIELQDPAAFKRKGSIRDLGSAGEDEVIQGDFFGLKDLDTNNPVVVDALIAIYKYWIAVADVDGFRVDTVKHVEPRFMARFTNAIHEYALKIGKRNFMIFGEIIGHDDLLHRYVGNNGPALGTEEWFPRLDAALDFPLYGVLDETIKAKRDCGDLRRRYDYFRQYYRDLGHAARYYVTFIDNHDQSHRPHRRFMHGVEHPNVAISGVGFLLTNLGIPCIYSGTEQGFDGGGDADVFIREAMFGGQWGAFDTTGMHFFNPEHPIYRGIAAVARARAEQPALRYGREYFRETSGDGEHFSFPDGKECTMAFSRILDTDEVVVIFNLSDQPRSDAVVVGSGQLPTGTILKNLLGNENRYTVEDAPSGTTFVRVPLEPHGMAILVRTQDGDGATRNP